MKGYLGGLKRLNEYDKPPLRKIRMKRHAMEYIMGDVIVIGFGSVLWSQKKLVLVAGELTPLCQGRHSTFIEGENLTDQI